MNNIIEVRAWLWRKLGIAAWRNGLPVGVDPYIDLHRLGVSPCTVFDIGANVGAAARWIAALWPDAAVYSFEPVKETFETLKREIDGRARIKPFPFALSDTVGEATISKDPTYSELSSLAHVHVQGSREEIRTTTLDQFVSDEGLNNVDLIKIDTEGHERSVLKGGERLFSVMPPSACIIEVGIEDQTRFVPFEDLRRWFGARGYRFAGLYDHIFDRSKGQVDRADALFIHSDWRKSVR
ncbi:FkbM family methyltransferase [Verrucomicrobiota bacterium sgz303538]